MRKQDIKPGVVYAYQARKHESPRPVMLLSTDLYEKHRRRGNSGTPWCTKAPAGSKPGTGWDGAATGYLVVIECNEWRQARPDPSQTAGRIARITLADLNPRKSAISADMEFDILPRLAPVVSTWEEAVAAQEAEREQADKEREHQAQQDARATAALSALGVPASWNGHNGQITMSLKSAEKLAALLGENPAAAEGKSDGT